MNFSHSIFINFFLKRGRQPHIAVANNFLMFRQAATMLNKINLAAFFRAIALSVRAGRKVFDWFMNEEPLTREPSNHQSPEPGSRGSRRREDAASTPPKCNGVPGW